MLTRIRSALGLRRPADLEEQAPQVPEESTALPEEAGPPLMVLISTGGVLSFQLHSFVDAESAAEFIQSRFPAGLKHRVFAFWALQEEPERSPEAQLRGTTDAVLFIRDPARPDVVELISCVDMKSAQSLVRGEAKEGLDLSLVMVYWAAPVTIESDEKGIFRVSPPAPPAVVRRAPAVEPARMEPAVPQIEEAEASATTKAPSVEEAPPAEPITEPEPQAPQVEEAEAEATVEAPAVEEAPPAEPITEPEPVAPQVEEVQAEAGVEAPPVEEAPPAEPITEPEPQAPKVEEVEAEAPVEAPAGEEAPPAEPITAQEPQAPQIEEAEPGTSVEAPTVEEPPPAEPITEPEPPAEAAVGPKVIIVDQDEAGGTELQKMLAMSSFAVLGRAGYGKEAIALASQSRPDVVMVAMEEPVARALRMVESLADLLPQSPIVVYSSITDVDIRRVMLAGAKDYLVTPVKTEELVRSVHTVLAQEERRRQRLSGEVEGPATVGNVITVFGAKGGIGKTTIATNLAAAIAQETRESVVLVDLDPRFGDVGILLDIPAERSIADLALPKEEITKELIQQSLYVHPTGVAILAGPVRPTDWRNVDTGHIERVVTLLAQTYDFVILDTPGTFNDIVMRALELANAVLLVTTPHVTTLKNTRMVINMLRTWNFGEDKIKLVLNATNDATADLPPQMKEMLGLEVFWSIPYDPKVPLAAQLGTPVVMAKTQSKAGDILTEMALALSDVRSYRRQSEGKDLTGGIGPFSEQA